MTHQVDQIKLRSKKLILLFFILLLLPPLLILLSRSLFEASYFTSSVYKLVFLFPVFYRVFIEKKEFKVSIFEHFLFPVFKKRIFSSLGIGAIFILIYVGAFYFFREYLDLQNVVDQLRQMADINVKNILFIGMYIILINSLLEEFFWRGFLFDKLRYQVRQWIAYLLTGIAFSFHHMVFYYNWFDLKYLIIITVGLSIYAMIMNFIFSKTKDLYTCWLIHGCADVAQIFIALKLFNLI